MRMLKAEEAALSYLARGWSVVPIHARDKRPIIRWQEYQQRRASEHEVRRWFREWPDANVGIVTGAVSGLVVLDIDPKHGGSESLAALERRHGLLPRTIGAVTGGGGRHIYFSHPGGVVLNRVRLAEGIDLRGDGGCVVAPPSVHVSGRRYEWVAGHGPGEIMLAPPPQWLLDEVLPQAGARKGHTAEHWRRLVTEGVPEGERNSTIASLAGHLLWHGVDDEVVLELLLSWNKLRCRPPLSDEEVARTVENISRLHRRGTNEVQA